MTKLLKMQHGTKFKSTVTNGAI